MAFLSDCWSLTGQRSYIKHTSSGDDRVYSQNHNPLTHIYNSDNPGTNTDISPGLIPPCTVWKSPMPPTGRSLIRLGFVYYRLQSQLQPETIGSHPRSRGHSIYIKFDKRGKKTEFSRVDTAPHGVETPVTLARIADWFELHSGPPP